MTGWQIQNTLNEKLTSEMIESKATVEINLSFNGLGDDECEELAKVIKQSKTIKRLVLENNHIHAKGAEALAAGKEYHLGQTQLITCFDYHAVTIVWTCMIIVCWREVVSSCDH